MTVIVMTREMGSLGLPLPARSRAPDRRSEAQTPPANTNGDRLTPIDYIVTFLLFLSTLTGPALVWTLLSL
jgi:hypothetical protein